MKFSFSTVGCPGWSFDEIYAAAKDLGYGGIEIRGIGSELYAPAAQPFSPENIAKTLERLRLGNIEIPVLDSNASLGTGDYSENFREAAGYIELAKKLGTKFVRVMISPQPLPEETDEAAARKMIRELCAIDDSVTLLVETNGIFCDTARLRDFIKDTGNGNPGVLWDIHHPFRYGGETVEQSFKNIGEYVRHIHIKDSVVENGAVKYRMSGYGDLPVKEALALLSGSGFGGFVSLEWVKRWNPELQEPGIVFAHFINYIRSLTAGVPPDPLAPPA